MQEKASSSLPRGYTLSSLGVLWSHTCSAISGGALGDEAQRHVRNILWYLCHSFEKKKGGGGVGKPRLA